MYNELEFPLPPPPSLSISRAAPPLGLRSTHTTATLSCVLNLMALLTSASASPSASISGFFAVSCFTNVAHWMVFTVSHSPSLATTSHSSLPSSIAHSNTAGVGTTGGDAIVAFFASGSSLRSSSRSNRPPLNS